MSVPPTYVGNTTLASNAVQDPSRVTPTHQTDDIALLTAQEANQDPSFVQQDSFAEVTGSPQGTGTAGAIGSTELRNYWKRLPDDTDETVQMSRNGGDHIAYVMHLYRGVKDTGNPWNLVNPATADNANGITTPGVTSGSIPGFTTSVDNCMVVITITNAVDSTVQQLSGFVNADLSDLQERFNQNHIAGVGGGITVVTGIKATAGPVGATTFSVLTSSKLTYQVIVLEPSTTVPQFPPITGSSSGIDMIRDPAALRVMITQAKTLDQLKTVLARELSRIARNVMAYERVAVLPFGATIRPSGYLSRMMLIPVTANTAITIANPEKPREGAEIILDINNQTAGVMGAITWGSEYVLDPATFVKPAAGKHRLITLFRSADGKWRERSRSQNDLS